MLFATFNILIIALVGLIAYWWANQGLFSAILHLLCVIAAGAVALAVWEPLTYGLLLRGSPFDDYAWGVSLVTVFFLTLLILRVTMDKTIGANVALPQWANLVFGFPVGAAAGVITMGIFLLGCGFIQSGNNILDFRGMARSGRNIESVNNLWLPVHELTADFYGLLSVNSLSTSEPLRQYYPQLAAQSASLLRDNYLDGRAKFSLYPPDGAVKEAIYSAGDRKYAVRVTFQGSARDFGEQLTLSKTQIRLIADARGTDEAKTIHPERWVGYDGVHDFDDISHYLTSEPAQANAEAVVIFDISSLNGVLPRFIQIRGTRYQLPPAQQGMIPTNLTGAIGTYTIDADARDITQAFEQANDIRPIQASSNNKPSGIELTEADGWKWISAGDGEFARSGVDRAPKGLAIKGVLEPGGARIVKVDVSRESVACIFTKAIADKAGENPEVMLVDTLGRAYLPIGFIHEKPDSKTRIFVDYVHYVPTVGGETGIPALPTSGGQNLKLLFAVTENVTIAGLKYGKATVGNCKFLVKNPKPAAATQPTSFGLTNK